MTTKVVVIVGSQRGGTTLLGRLLGEVEGFVFGGELRDVWDKGMEVECGCGLDHEQCPVWSQVLARVEAGGASPAQVATWRDQVVPDRHSWLHTGRLSRPGAGSETEAGAGYAAAMGRLYGALAAVTGTDVVVDSSKHPNDAVLANRLPGVDAFLLHVVRDPRGAAYSVVHRHQRAGRSAAGLIVDAAHTTLQWLTRHLATERLGRALGASRYLRVRYEDLVESPDAVLGQITEWACEPQRRRPGIDDGWVGFGVAHTTGGRSRLGAARLRLEHDARWTAGLGAPARALVTTLAWPLMRRYGYRRRPPR